MRINNNIMSLNAHRQLGANQQASAKSMERLSSGLRINRAGDDAAGLAISEKMRGQIRGLNQASRNAQDGISLIQTAEGALNETHAILQRMRELAVQAATDVATDADRAEIQAEVDQLASEISRISNTTEFNQSNLLAGGFADKNILIGANQGQNVSFAIGRMDAASLGVASDIISTNLANDSAGITEASLRDGTAAAKFAGETISIASSILQADTAGEVRGADTAQTIVDAQAAEVVGSAFGTVGDASSASIAAFKVMNTTATFTTDSVDLGNLTAATQGTYVTGTVDSNVLDNIADGTLRFEIEYGETGNTNTHTIDIAVGTGEEFVAGTDSGADLASLLQTKLSGAIGESVTVSYADDEFTLTVGDSGTKTISITSVQEDAEGTPAALGAFTDGEGPVPGTAGMNTFDFTINGSPNSITLTDGVDGLDITDGDSVAAALSSKLSAAAGQTISVNFSSGVFTFESTQAGSDQEIVLTAVTDEAGSTVAGFTGGAASSVQGTGTGAVDGEGYGVIKMSIDDVEFAVTINQNSTLDNVLDNINSAANAALGTSGQAYASQSGGAIEITSLTSGVGSSVKILGDFESDGTTNANGALMQNLGLSLSETSQTGMSDVGRSGTAGTFGLTVNGVSFDVTVGDADDIDDVISTINTAAGFALASKDASDNLVLNTGAANSGEQVGSSANVIIAEDDNDGRTLEFLGLTAGTYRGEDATAGSLRLSIDGTEFSVALADGDTVGDVANAINVAANTALGTSGGNYASVSQGKLVIESQTSGSNSSVGVISDNTSGRTIEALGLQVGAVSGANNGQLQVVASVNGVSESIAIDTDADIVQFSQAFAGLTLTKEAAHNTAGTVQIETSRLSSQAASLTADGRVALQATVQKGILVDTQDAADHAVTAIDSAINTVSSQRSELGALQNRLEHTISNLGTSSENLQAAESRIRDLDMAAEMMGFTKSNILNQAATAMLAQANMAPQNVLQLLG